ncbi:uncharacterized protein METZ01_LOCUS307473, partial [marine metagenome]
MAEQGVYFIFITRFLAIAEMISE